MARAKAGTVLRTVDGITEKLCSSCKAKPVADFAPGGTSHGESQAGRHCQCRPCNRESQRKSRIRRATEVLTLTLLFVLTTPLGFAEKPSRIDVKRVQALAEQGIPEAEALLGQMYFDGRAVHRDYREAYIWFQKAADMGNPTTPSVHSNSFCRRSGMKSRSECPSNK